MWIIKMNSLVHSDPYVRIDLNTINGDINIDSVLTKTKKKVSIIKSLKVLTRLNLADKGNFAGVYLIDYAWKNLPHY